MKLDPPIGVPRTYQDRVELLYPGEDARYEIAVSQIAEIIAQNQSTHPEQPFRVALTGTWHVTPSPGPYGWWLRTWFKVTTYIKQRAEKERENAE